MRISEIHVDRCGVWRDLSLARLRPGVNVVYGPNEAGKTTLLGFIRGVLYGFPSSIDDRRFGVVPEVERSGSLTVIQDGEAFEIARLDAGSGPGLVGVRGLGAGPRDDERTDAERLRDLLHGTNATLFEHVFAIGLHELQELATLEGDEVAGHIHGLALGPEGRRLLDVTQAIDGARRRLFDPGSDSGRIVEFRRRHAELSSEIAALGGRREEHARLVHERRRLVERIDAAKRERNDLHRQLRGHLFLERAHAPWRQVRELKAELAALPHLAGFPESGLAQLDELEADLDSARRCRDALLAEAAEFRAEAAELQPEEPLARHAGELRGLVESREWIAGLVEAVARNEAAVEEAETGWQDSLAALGTGWDAVRLERAAIPATLLPELLAAARRYQAALVRRGRLRKRRRQLSSAVHRRTVEAQQRLAALGGDSLDDALAKSRKRLADLQDLGRLELRLAEFEQRRSGMEQERARLQDHPQLPRWVSGVLGFFGVTGLVFLGLGIATGFTTSGVAGLAYALLGFTCGGMAWALKSHFEREVKERLADLEHGLRENDERLRETREVVSRIVRQDGDPRAADGPSPAVDALLADQARRIATLEQLAAAVAAIGRMRGRLIEIRSRYRTVLREVSDARQEWCELLRRAGMPETVSIEEGFAAAGRLIAARDAVAALRTLRESLARDRTALESTKARMERIGRLVDRWNSRAPLGAVLDGWAESLDELRRQRTERRRLVREIKKRRDEAREYARRIEEAGTRRSALLVRGGAATRDEFEERAELVVRRKELDELLALAEEDLSVAIRAEPELVIVEEDLIAFDVEENQQRIAALNGQLAHLEDEREAADEQLGGVKHALHELAVDRTAARLRLEREQAGTELRRTVEEWLGTLLAARTIERMRREFERTHQPATLRAASRYLAAFTEGKFESVWAPLGERQLLVDDERGRTRALAELSGGTREQVLLAVRLAVADRLTAEGVALPLVLDDVFVNFDQQRTEAAVRTIIDFAGGERQVLVFTCHQHLAETFQRRGIEPIALPEHAEQVERRRAG
ncbi:MAG: AAA family ATPase [Planctomycetales bacterium]